MALPKDVKLMGQRAAGAVSLPVPNLVIPPLPDKIARIDPEGARDWVNRCNQSLADWVKKQNSVNLGITAAIKK